VVSKFRDALAPEWRAALDEALASVGPLVKAMQEEVARKATVEGPRAVAEASHAVRGGLKSADQVEAAYREHLAEERRKQDGGAVA
jgi:hypothetical protein